MGSTAIQKAKKLQYAINHTYHSRILINTSQWYSEDRNCPMNMYTVKQVVFDESGKKSKIELFKTYSALWLLFFLRDYWYELSGIEIPTDNDDWEEEKQKYYEKSKET